MPKANLEVNLKGAKQLAEIARTMREAGRKDLQRDMRREIRAAGDDLVKDLRRSVRSLPSRSNTGLRDAIAKATGVQITTTRKRSAIRVWVNRRRLPPGKRGMADVFEVGKWRKPVFADAEHETRGEWTWRPQRMPPGWFQKPVDRNQGRFPAAAQQVLDKFKAKVERL